MKKLFALCMLMGALALLNACALGLGSKAAGPNPDIANELRPGLKWGLSMEAVRGIEKDLTEIESDGSMILFEPATFFNVPNSKVAYFFHQNQLAAVLYLIDSREIKPEGYFDLFARLSADLALKYGEQPETKADVPLGMADSASARAQALRNGELAYAHRWTKALTLLKLENMNGYPAITLQFSNAAKGDEIRKAIQGDAAAVPTIALPQGISWDMPQQAVLKLHQNKPMHSDPHTLLFHSKTENANVLTAYTFIDGKLAMLDNFYILNDGSPSNYIAAYEIFMKRLAGMYGASSNKIARLDGKKEPAQDLAKALQNGEIAFEAVWPPDGQSMLMLLLQYDEIEKTCMLIHKLLAVKYVNVFMPATP